LDSFASAGTFQVIFLTHLEYLECTQLHKLHEKQESISISAPYVKKNNQISLMITQIYAAINLPVILLLLPLALVEDGQVGQNVLQYIPNILLNDLTPKSESFLRS